MTALTVATTWRLIPCLASLGHAQETGAAPRIRTTSSLGRIAFNFFTKRGNRFPGVAYDVSVGTAVVAPTKGRIRQIGKDQSQRGVTHFVWIDHAAGYALLLANLSKIVVTDSQEVQRGDLVGYSGAIAYQTGTASEMLPQLYWAVVKDRAAIDPEKTGLGGRAPTYWNRSTDLDSGRPDGVVFSAPLKHPE